MDALKAKYNWNAMPTSKTFRDAEMLDTMVGLSEWMEEGGPCYKDLYAHLGNLRQRKDILLSAGPLERHNIAVIRNVHVPSNLNLVSIESEPLGPKKKLSPSFKVSWI